jgi:hypothetical protein
MKSPISLRQGGAPIAGLAAVVVAGALAGCGLISSDVTNFTLALPDKKFSVDAAGWQVDTTAANLYLNQSCAAAPDACAKAVSQACTTGCTGMCNTAKKCDLSLDLSLSQPVNLVMEQPELKTINDQPAIKVSIDSVTYEVPTNTLNVATPALTIYVAPMSVVKSTDPLAKPIGTIPAIAAGTTTTAPQAIQFTDTGKADLVNIMSTFKTPFNVLVGGSLVVTAGQAVPSGKLDAVVHIRGHAGLK